MATEINTGAPRVGTSSRGNDRARKAATAPETAGPVPARAQVNFIPSAESLATIIDSAVAALRKGVRWDRGTILNLVV